MVELVDHYGDKRDNCTEYNCSQKRIIMRLVQLEQLTKVFVDSLEFEAIDDINSLNKENLVMKIGKSEFQLITMRMIPVPFVN